MHDVEGNGKEPNHQIYFGRKGVVGGDIEIWKGRINLNKGIK
jgi:hypothetical protein